MIVKNLPRTDYFIRKSFHLLFLEEESFPIFDYFYGAFDRFANIPNAPHLFYRIQTAVCLNPFPSIIYSNTLKGGC